MVTPTTSTTVSKTIRIYPTQRDFLNCPSLYKSFVAGISSGKSYAGAYDMIRRAKRGRLYMVIAPTYTLLGDSTFRSFKQVADDHLGLIRSGDLKMSAPPKINLATGAEILFRSGDEPDKLRGPNLSGIWLDEASLMKEEVFKIAIGRLRQEGEQGWLSATFTPKGKKHWSYKTFGTGQNDTAMFRAKTADNPFNPPGFEALLRTKYSLSEAKQELDGLFLDEGGNHFNPREWPKYDDIGDAWSLREQPTRKIFLHKEMLILVAIDVSLGLKKTSDFTSIVVAGLTPGLTSDYRVLILEVFNKQLRLEAIGSVLDDICRRWGPVCVAGEDDNLSQAMLLEWRRWPNIPEVRKLPIASKAKIVRAQAAIIMGENKRIYLPDDASWLDDYCDQLAAFTGVPDKAVQHDDLADATGIIARLVNLLRGGNERTDDEPVGALDAGRQVWG